MADKSLVTLVMDFADLDRQLIESGGEITPALEQAMVINADNFMVKVDGYKMYMDNLDSRAMYFKDLENQMKSGRQIFENHKLRLKDNLKFAMHSMGMKELQGGDWRFTLSAMKDKLLIDESKLPPAYFKKVESVVPDRERIEGDLLLGKTITGVTTEPVESLRSYVNHAGRARPVKEK